MPCQAVRVLCAKFLGSPSRLQAAALLVLAGWFPMEGATPKDLPPRPRLEQLLARTTPHEGQGVPHEQLGASTEALGLARQLGDAFAVSQALVHVGYWRYQAGDPQGSLEAYLQAREACLGNGDLSGVSHVEENLGHIFLYVYSDFRNAQAFYDRALETARQTKDANRIVKALSHLGNLQLQKGNYRLATLQFTQALAICDDPAGLQLGIPQGRSVAQREARAVHSLRMTKGVLLSYLSTVHLQLDNLSAAQDAIEKARGIFATGGSYRDYGQSRVDLQWGHLHLRKEAWGPALASFRAALEARERLGIPLEAASIRHWVGVTLHRAGRMAEALATLDQALQARRAHGDQLGIAETTLEIGQILLGAGRLEEAKARLEECRKLCEAQGFLREARGVHRALALLHERQGDLKQALLCQRRYSELENQVQGPRTTAAVLALLATYEQEKATREARSLERARWRGSFLGALGVGLGIATLLFLRRRRRGKTPGTEAPGEPQATPEGTAPPAFPEVPVEVRPKYANAPLSEATAQTYRRKLFALMAREHPHRDPECTQLVLARRLSLNQGYLSQLFNQYLQVGFSDFMNAFRVVEAMDHLRSPDHAQETVLEIGYAVGFNSKTTFYRAFRALVGVTPAEYRSHSDPESLRQRTLALIPFHGIAMNGDSGPTLPD